MRRFLALTLALIILSAPSFADENGLTLAEVIASQTRDPKLMARDGSRHPHQELEFFGIKPDMTVIEIWPGKGYWTEILSPYLKSQGTYFVAIPPGDTNPHLNEILNDTRHYGNIRVLPFSGENSDLVPEGSADAILTFRNLHNWIKMGTADTVMNTFFHALRQGGILGIEDHRGLPNVPQDVQTQDGYIREDVAIELAKKAGFEFVASSPINNNPKDTKKWPKGVWTLPPTLSLGEVDREKYEKVGEADNFVLLFRKPFTP